MKSVVIHRIALAMSLLLLTVGVVAYLYLRHSRISQTEITSLYSLVPADAIAVVETDDVVAFVDDVSEGSLIIASLPTSDIVNYLRDYVHEFLEASPHGLSTQLSKVLLSYHQPENSVNQILYCSVEDDDAPLLQEFFTRYFMNPVSEPEMLSYKGEDIAVYQMADGHMLSAYLTDNLLALSFSNELLQQVIEAQQESGTLSSNAAFMNLQNNKSSFARTAVYQKIDNQWEMSY